MLLVLCLFSKDNNCTQKTEIPISKLHWCNLMDWVIRLSLHIFCLHTSLKKNATLHSSSLIKQDFDSYKFMKVQNMLKESHSILQHQLCTFLKLKTKNFKTFTRFAILLSDNIHVNSAPDSNLCDSCGKRVNKRCLCCIKCNVKIHKKCYNERIFENDLCNKCKMFIIISRDFSTLSKTYHSIRQ